jgi:hypothetical protein
MIPHDGGPCPVDGIILTRSHLHKKGSLVISVNIKFCKKGDDKGWTFPDDDGLIKKYCPIEIQEGAE